jgi:hypothetical protein
MNRWDSFTFRVSQDERQLIAALAEKLQRTQSDAVRFVLREAAHEHHINLPKATVKNGQSYKPAKGNH